MGLDRLQLIIGISFLVSAFSGIYLLATDGSLWLLAVSHAVGLIVIVSIDIILGILNLMSLRRAYVPSLAAALLAFVLQLGDIATAPQYNMTVTYFAGYLFSLWAFDVVLATQAVVLSVGLAGRGYASHLARVRTRRGKEIDYTRRGFFKTVVGLAALIGVGVAVGSVKLPANTAQPSQTTQSNLPSGAIADSKTLQSNSPVYFEYPSGYPNILLKKSDGSMVALSMLCTHVCCECSYDSSNDVIYCPCHGSVFDSKGAVLRGPAGYPLPSIGLRVDGSGYIYPTGVSGSSPCVGA